MRIVYNNRSGCFTICTTKNKPSKKDTMLGTEPPLLGDAETNSSDCSLCYEQDMKTNGCIFNTACYQSGTWDKTVCDRVNGKLCPSIATDNLPPNINYAISDIIVYYNETIEAKNITDKYGPIEYWDVGGVTDMSFLLTGFISFNTDISRWNVSSVTDMSVMFFGATAFNQPLNSWNVSSVTDMGDMFYQATAFNQPLNSWDVSNVGYMGNMFNSATNFNQDITKWDVSNVTDMNGMFNSATNFNQNISGWDINDAVIKNPYHYENFATGSPLLQNIKFLPEKLQRFFNKS